MPEMLEAEQPVRNLDAFRQRWGDCGFEEPQLKYMWHVAKSSASHLPYHNFEHTLDTLWSAMELVDQLEADGIEVNRRVLVGASLFHDAAYHRSPQKNDQPASRESYSAKLFAKHAPDFGYDKDEIKLGKRVIKDTSHYRKPRSPESKVLIRADIDNVSRDYETEVLPNTHRLHEELTMLGHSTPFKRHARLSVKVLARYVKRDLSLGSDDSSFPMWEGHVLNNLYELASNEANKVPRSLLRLLGSSAINQG
jgi:hypothetical protein